MKGVKGYFVLTIVKCSLLCFVFIQYCMNSITDSFHRNMQTLASRVGNLDLYFDGAQCTYYVTSKVLLCPAE